MTLFVSRHAQHVVEIWSGNQELMNVNGSPKMVTRMPQLAAEFEPKGLTNSQRQAAARMFGMIPYGTDLVLLPNSIDLGDDENGALIGRVGWRPGYATAAAATANPRAHDDIVLTDLGPIATDAYDPQFHLGRYDTGDGPEDPASMIPYKSVKANSKEERIAVWVAVEEALRECDDYGTSIIALDMATLPPPFPGFAKIKGDSKTAVDQMRVVCDLAQFNAGVLLEYERDTQKRPNMLALFEELYKEQLATAQRQADVLAGLEVTL